MFALYKKCNGPETIGNSINKKQNESEQSVMKNHLPSLKRVATSRDRSLGRHSRNLAKKQEKSFYCLLSLPNQNTIIINIKKYGNIF